MVCGWDGRSIAIKLRGRSLPRDTRMMVVRGPARSSKSVPETGGVCRLTGGVHVR